ncbi:MAG TPA: hypothetical protein VJB14_15670 [Planctomycetota bacterium]|nr:hypothetical protein [Planctomycetota bacterium]
MDVILLSVLASLACDTRAVEPGRTRGHELNSKEGPTATWKADLALTLERKGREWVFVLRGTTRIPDEVRLRAHVYAVELFLDPVQGRREDEEPLVWEDEEEQPATTAVDRVSGRFRTDVCRFARKPWSLLYRARLQYRPRDQSGEVLERFGEGPWDLHVDLRVGTEASYAEELQAHFKRSAGDLRALERLHRDLRRKVEELPRAASAAWKAPWLAAVEEIDVRNRHRFSLWAVWSERQTKMRIGGMCELFRRILKAAEAGEGRVAEMIDGWRDYFDEAIDQTGIPAPFDFEQVGPVVADYEIGFGPLRAWFEDRAREDVRQPARRECLTALLKLTSLAKGRRVPYKYVNEICVRLTRLHELSDDPPTPENQAAVRTALEEHDRAVQDFVRFAKGE